MIRGILTILLAFSFFTAGCLGSQQEIDIFYGEDINPSVPANDFTLIDENGENFSLHELDRKSVV